MLRLALVSAATYGADQTQPGSFHGTAFATAFNGFAEEHAAAHQWTFVRCGERLPDARIVKVWDRDRTWAERLALACDIPEVIDSPADAVEDVDAVIVVDDGSREQWRWAVPALEAGLPTFIDKPLAMNARDARGAIQLAERHGAKLMSASSLRFVPDIQGLKAEAAGLEPIHLATTICGNELIYYGIHALEMAYEVLGAGAVSVLNVGQPGRNICRVRFESGRDLVLMVAERDYMQAGYQICLHGLKGWKTVRPDLTNLYVYLMSRFIDMVKGAEPPVPYREMHEVIAVLEAGVRSLERGEEVSVAEVMAEGG